MSYLIIFMLAIRVFICEKVYPTAGIFFDICFCLCFILYILMSRGKVVNRKFFIYPLVFSGLLLLNTIFSVNIYNSQNEVLKLCVYMLIFSFVYLLDQDKRAILLSAVLLISVLISLRAIYQYLSGMDYIKQNYAYEQIVKQGFYAIEMLKQKRVVSWFLSPNLLAGYLVMIAPLAGGYAVNSYQQKQIKQAVFFIVVFIAAAAGLYLTRSWGAYLGFAAAVLFMIFSLLKGWARRSKNTKEIIFGVLILLGCSALLSQRGECFLDAHNPQNSLLQRLYYWQSATKIIKENPMVGIGLGNFGIIYPRFKQIDANETIYAHNIFLQLCSELGIIIFGFLIIFVIYLFLNARKNIELQKPVYIGLSAAVIAFLIHNLFGFSFFAAQCGYIFILTAACLFKPQESLISKKNNSFISGDFFYKTGYILISGLMIFFLTREYNSQILLDEAALCLKQGKIDTAIVKANRALKSRANNDEIYYFLAVCAKQKTVGKFSLDVVKFYNKAIDLNPKYAFYYYYLGNYYYAYKFYPQAKKEYLQAIKYYPDNKKFQEIYAQISRN